MGSDSSRGKNSFRQWAKETVKERGGVLAYMKAQGSPIEIALVETILEAAK